MALHGSSRQEIAVETVKDTRAMIAGMNPVIREEVWIYCHSDDAAVIAAGIPDALGIIREEDVALILPRDKALALGFDISVPLRQITLQVASALDGYGLTAAFAGPLAEASIPCNVVAGFRHDHLLIPAHRAEEAMAILRLVQAKAATTDMPAVALANNADRLNAFSDGVIAVIITLMVLELKAPAVSSYAALLPLWPEALSYALSYLFIAIIWVNHHHLMRFVTNSTPRLVWINFLHLFLVALLPFATQWVAKTDLGSAAVSAYAGLFICVDAAFLAFERQVMAQADCSAVPERAKRLARRRSLTTLAIFAMAMASAVWLPILGMALILVALSVFLRPEVPGMQLVRRSAGNPSSARMDPVYPSSRQG
jgi:uncharacterized membrane protein